MKIWASYIGTVVYVLVENPKKENEFIEVNLRPIILKSKRRHKRINIRIIFRLPGFYLRIYDKFPVGYRRDWYFEGSLYVHSLYRKLVEK